METLRNNPYISLMAIKMALKNTKLEQAIIVCGGKQFDNVDEMQKYMENTYNRLRIIYRIDKDIEDMTWYLKDLDGNKLIMSKGDGSV